MGICLFCGVILVRILSSSDQQTMMLTFSGTNMLQGKTQPKGKKSELLKPDLIIFLNNMLAVNSQHHQVSITPFTLKQMPSTQLYAFSQDLSHQYTSLSEFELTTSKKSKTSHLPLPFWPLDQDHWHRHSPLAFERSAFRIRDDIMGSAFIWVKTHI